MKAIRVSSFGSEDVLRYIEIETPRPGPGQVGVEIYGAGVNPVETYIRQGTYPWEPDLPYTPGNDGAGIVDSIGPGVTGLVPGQPVFLCAVLARRNTGTYAQVTVCDAQAVFPLPAGLSFAQGAALGTPGLAAAYALFTRAALQPGERVLIHGASGAVGTLAVQLARRAGGRVLGTAGSREGRAAVEALGAERVFDHNAPDATQSILAATGGQGLDVIIEMAAHRNLPGDLTMLAPHGRVVVVGSRGVIDFDPRSVMNRDAAVLGMNVANMPQEAFCSNMAVLQAALAEGVRPLVGKEMPLAQAAQAHREVNRGEGGKHILLPKVGPEG